MIFHYAQENSKLVFNIKNNEIFVFLTLFWFSPDITINLEKHQLQNKYDKLSNNYTQLQETVSGKKKKEIANIQDPILLKMFVLSH